MQFYIIVDCTTHHPHTPSASARGALLLLPTFNSYDDEEEVSHTAGDEEEVGCGSNKQEEVEEEEVGHATGYKE